MIPALLVSASLAIPAALPPQRSATDTYVETLAWLRAYQIACPPEPELAPAAILFLRGFIGAIDPKVIPLADQKAEQISTAVAGNAGKTKILCESMRPAVVKANKDFGGG